MQTHLQPVQQSNSQEIEVTLLLAGGHQYTLPIQSDAPLLRQLFEVLVDAQSNQSDKLFQIPVHKGRAVISFRGDHLVGLVTEPPLIIQQQPASSSDHPAALEPPAPANDTLLSHYVHLEQFLSPDELEQLLKYTLERESDFVPTSTSTGDLDYRKSVVLHYFPEFSEPITQRIRTVLPDVLSKLAIEPFPVTQIESQLTGHNDGNYYRVHNDNGSAETATRVLTYVYYFYREPKAFSGGELVLYDSKIENGYYVQADTFKTVEPRNNSIVFFPSRYMHEVLPIHCPSRQFADSRFTINGWIRR